MSDPSVVTFFYGSYINREVLREVDLVPERTRVARLPGFDITIRPLANLVESDEKTVYGVLASATHAELDRLYAHARSVLGGVYLPRAVLAYTAGGQAEPALCYLAPNLPTRPASEGYIQRILGPARELGFPRWYLERLESFLPRRTD